MGRSLSLSLLLVLVPLAPAQAGPPEIGQVVAVEGRATAGFPGEAERVLACGDTVHEGERLSTVGASRLVVAGDGRHAHLGPDGLLVLQRGGVGELETLLLQGGVRLLDMRGHPFHRIATPAGPVETLGRDLEIVRVASGAVEICDWSSAPGECRRVERGGVEAIAVEGPRLDRGMRDTCDWMHEPSDLVHMADFAAPPPVAADSESPSFEPEDDPDPPCGADECSGGPVGGPPDLRVLTVAPPPIAIPFD